MLIVSLLIKLTVELIFYRQERVGRTAKSLRSTSSEHVMRRRREVALAQISDPGSRVGRIIRCARIDELRSFNIALGEMSMVGPRPERPCFVEQLSAIHLCCAPCRKPGITGWAQINVPYTASIEDTAKNCVTIYTM